MSTPPPLVDIHCHLLPGVDDGAADWDESLAMARLAVADGISTVVATPHQLGSYGHNHGDLIRARTAQLQQLLNRHQIPLRVLPGADVRIEPDIVEAIQSGEVLTLADRRRYVLLELPHEVYFPLDRLLRQLDTAGIVAILSHPERNLAILGQPRLVQPLVDAGCLLQVTAGSIVGTFGPQVSNLARRLLRQGLVDLVATDAHGAKLRRPLLRRAFDCVARLVGQPMAADLCCGNPARVVAGTPASWPRPKSRKPRRATWFRWSKAG